MRITGANLLKIAGRAISKQAVTYRAFVRNESLPTLVEVPVYEDHAILAHIQPLESSQIAQLGLEFNGDHIRIWGNLYFGGIDRDTSTDVIVWKGQDYKINTRVDWTGQDGWGRAIATRVTNAKR